MIQRLVQGEWLLWNVGDPILRVELDSLSQVLKESLDGRRSLASGSREVSSKEVRAVFEKIH
jgi:hypothetical protein